MSIVVLTSRGQDPAEFENHFPRGIKLPRNAEICLCGVNLTKADDTAGITITGENNDSFLVLYGNGNFGGYAPYGSYRVKVRPGTYSPQDLASQIIQALAVGNYNEDFRRANYSDIPVSPLRLGLFCSYDTNTNKMKFTADRNYVTRYPVLDRDWLGTKFITSCGQDLGGSPGTIPGNVVNNQTFNWLQDPRYAGFYPTETANCMLKTDALWNGSNGAAPLQPTDPAVSTFGGANNDIIPAYQYGWRWGVLIDADLPIESVLGMRGGIVTSNKVWNETTHTNYDIRDEFANTHDLRLDWAVGGPKWDLWWQVDEFRGTQGGNGFYIVNIYYHPISKEQTGNEVWDETNAIRVGQGQFDIGNPGAEIFNEIVFRPVDGTLGDNANAYAVPNANDARKCCIDFRVNSLPALQLNAPQPGASRVANNSGTAGYVAVTDGGQFDLYKRGPIYMGYAHRNNDYPPIQPGPRKVGAVLMQGIEHEQPTTDLRSMSGIQYNRWVDDPANVTNPNYSFLDVTFAFSPLLENLSSNAAESIQAGSTRFSNIAAAIGFRERRTAVLTSANSANGLESDFAVDDWEASAPLAVIQLPDIGIDGDLGGGNSVWGGSVSANILGIVPIVNGNTTNSRSCFYEPSNENYIKVKNLAADSLNSIKVKITDTTGRKLTGLTPDSNIWVKFKCGSDGSNLTQEKVGAVNPITKAPNAIDALYRHY